MKFSKAMFHTSFFIRLFNWEYWPFNLVYAWVTPYWFLLSFRSRSFFFFNASNPRFENGGFLNESKKDIHAILPPGLYPQSIHFSIPADPDKVFEQISNAGLQFPMMGKPDIGGRGRGVKKINNKEELCFYTRNSTLDFHLQEFIDYKNEVGIFYCRYPGQVKGQISGIVRKEFLAVTGDGKSTVKELLKADQRGLIYLGSQLKTPVDFLSEVPEKGIRLVVSPYGNHARGSLFLDESHLVEQALNDRMDKIADQIPDFYFGRLDIRYHDWESLKKGERFSVIEVNGAGSEPTHIYDPKHSIFFAWKEITRHWRILNKISRMNHERGIPYLTFSEGCAVFRKDKEISAKLDLMPV